MRSLIYVVLKLCFGIFLLLTSFYCLLAYIPYTYLFLIKEPPYGWLIKFPAYHVWLYWCAVAAALFLYWPQRKKATAAAGWLLLVGEGIVLTWSGFFPHIQSTRTTYFAGVLTLLPLLLLAGTEILSSIRRTQDSSLISYSNTVIAALCIAVLSAGGIAIRNYSDTGKFGTSANLHNVELAVVVLTTYFWLAFLVVSLANLLTIGLRRIRPNLGAARALVLGSFVLIAVFTASFRFLQNMLNFRGWAAYLYSGTLAAALTVWGFTLLRPLLRDNSAANSFHSRTLAAATGLCLVIAMLLAPAAIGERDWNGILQSTLTLLFWTIFSICLFRIRPRPRNYSAAGTAAVLLISGSLYWGITETAFLWAKHVGTTDGEIEQALEGHAEQSVSFDFAYHWMGGRHAEPCGELCLVLRQYTNIPKAELNAQLNLVDHFTPSSGTRPNIFIFVIDSMRPDYLGAYNPHADFSPNLDALARDSIVFRRAYTSYAGTTLSEPSIWSGALLLHSQPLHPFKRVNSLEKLVNGDGYQMVLSYDWVLRSLLSPADSLVKLDGDKAWNHFEIGSTLQQLEAVLDRRPENARPVFFYAQPMNVHQFANNDRPLLRDSHWATRPGFNNRAAFDVHQVDDSFGDFFLYLKKRGLYDNSIIIVTADHGDAMGGPGRSSHSTIIYPEVMHVPLILHLPAALRGAFVSDPDTLASLIDVAPTLYYLLGHKPLTQNPLIGRSLVAENFEELRSYARTELFLASDARAAYGLLNGNGRFMYVTYDSPPRSLLFDLANDPEATQNILTDATRKQYEPRVISYLHRIADFYGYKPDGNEALAARARR